MADASQDQFCRAVNRRGAPVTMYAPDRGAVLVIAKAGGELVCTQDAGHQRSHAACDGQGHILARWPREAVERYWQPGEYDHG